MAKWLGQNPEQQLQDDLDRFKMYIESGAFVPFSPQAGSETWKRTDEGQFRAQDTTQFNESQEPESPDPKDLNHNMPG